MGNCRTYWLLQLILWTVLSCLILSGAADRVPCPQLCNCRGKVAVCTYLTLFPEKFPEEIVNITITQSTFMSLGPMVIGKQTRNIAFKDTEITEIVANFLHDSNSPITVEFSKVIIHTIASNSFNNIQNLISLSFTEAVINVIEEEAFTSLSAIGEIKMLYVNVETIKSKAFSNVSVSKIIISDCDIGILERSSFHSVYNVDLFKLNEVTIRNMRRGTFTNLSHIRRVHLENCNFLAMECNAIMDLREATLKHNDSFFFSKSILECDCSSVSLFNYVQWNPTSVSDTVLCFSNESGLSGPVQSIKDKFARICSNKSPSSCKVDDVIETTGTTEASYEVNVSADSVTPRPVTENVVTRGTSEASDEAEVTMGAAPPVHVAENIVPTARSKAPGQDVQSVTSYAQISAHENVATRNTLQDMVISYSLLVCFMFLTI